MADGNRKSRNTNRQRGSPKRRQNSSRTNKPPRRPKKEGSTLSYVPPKTLIEFIRAGDTSNWNAFKKFSKISFDKTKQLWALQSPSNRIVRHKLNPFLVLFCFNIVLVEGSTFADAAKKVNSFLRENGVEVTLIPNSVSQINRDLKIVEIKTRVTGRKTGGPRKPVSDAIKRQVANLLRQMPADTTRRLNFGSIAAKVGLSESIVKKMNTDPDFWREYG